MDAKFKVLIAEALEMEVDYIDGSLALDPEDNWDSVALLSVISAIDAQYGLQLNGEELAACRVVTEIYELICKSQI